MSPESKPLFKVSWDHETESFHLDWHFECAPPGDQDVSFALGARELEQVYLAIRDVVPGNTEAFHASQAPKEGEEREKRLEGVLRGVVEERDALMKQIASLKAKLTNEASRIPAGWQKAEAYEKDGNLVVIGEPESEDESHNCDQMGCGSLDHVVFRADMKSAQAPASDEVKLSAEDLWFLLERTTINPTEENIARIRRLRALSPKREVKP